MSDDAQDLDTGTGVTEETTNAPEFEKPTSFQTAFNPVPVTKSEGLGDLGTGFLKGMPEEDAAKLRPYVEQWDKNYSTQINKFRTGYEEKLSAYGDLDVGDATEALELRNLIQSNPAEAVRLITAEYLQTQQENASPEAEAPEGSILDELPPEIRDRLLLVSKLEEGMRALLDERAAEITAKKEAQETADFVKSLTELDTKFQNSPEYKGIKANRDVILRFIATEMSPEEAYTTYFNMVKNTAQEKLKEHNASPPVLGNGSIPSADIVPIHKLSDKDRKKAVIQMLSNQGDH